MSIPSSSVGYRSREKFFLHPRGIHNVGGHADADGRLSVYGLKTAGFFTRCVDIELKQIPEAQYFVSHELLKHSDVDVSTIMTLPETAGRHPALFLIQGIGNYSIDVPLDSAKAYALILRRFALEGFVTLRVDKPGIGQSGGGPYDNVDFNTELDFFKLGLDHLISHQSVDPRKILIFGDSLGGVIAPLLADGVPLRGLAVHGTLMARFNDYAVNNMRRQALLNGYSFPEIEAAIEELGLLLESGYEKSPEDNEVIAEIFARLAPEGSIYGKSLRFWHQVNDLDLATIWDRCGAKVLTLWSENDFLSEECHQQEIASIINRRCVGSARYVRIQASDHAFRKTLSIEDSFQRWTSADAEFNPCIIDLLMDWAHQLVCEPA